MTCTYIEPIYRERELSEDDKLLRQAFVDQYMKYRNAYRACIELGFMAPYANDWAKMFMDEGYVRRLITEKQRAINSKEAQLERQQTYRTLMEEQATYYGPGASHSSRVAAIAHLMKLEGMFEGEIEANSVPSVMVVPNVGSVEQWSNNAGEQQRKLKEDVQK